MIKILGMILTIGGMAALIYAVVELFDGTGVGNGGTWAALLLGVLFFFGGIGLLKSAGGK